MTIIVILWLYGAGALIAWALFDTGPAIFKLIMIILWFFLLPLGIAQELIEKRIKRL